MKERFVGTWFLGSVDMLFGYVRQELVDPLRNSLRWIAFGLLGGLFVLIGATMVAIGALRLLQSAGLPFQGGWSWVPYLVVTVAGIIAVTLTLSRISRHGLNSK
jgi:hypothetical protein